MLYWKNRMTRKSCLVALLVCSGLAMPATAQAELHWFSNGNLVKEGRPVSVKSKGPLTFTVFNATATCTLKDKGTVLNPVGGGTGTGTISKFKVSGCQLANQAGSTCTKGKIRVTAEQLPWSTLLVSEPGKVRVYISVGTPTMSNLTVTCKKPFMQIQQSQEAREFAYNPVFTGNELDFGNALFGGKDAVTAAKSALITAH